MFSSSPSAFGESRCCRAYYYTSTVLWPLLSSTVVFTIGPVVKPFSMLALLKRHTGARATESENYYKHYGVCFLKKDPRAFSWLIDAQFDVFIYNVCVTLPCVIDLCRKAHACQQFCCIIVHGITLWEKVDNWRTRSYYPILIEIDGAN